MSETEFEAQVAAALEFAWRKQWPEEGPNFINPGLVGRELARQVAAALEAACNPATRVRREAALAALRSDFPPTQK